MDIPITRAWIAALATAVDEQADYLDQLDSAIGDADHGGNLSRGFAAVVDDLDRYDASTVGDVLVRTGTTLAVRAGGAAGPLYGTFFRTTGTALEAPTAYARELGAAMRVGLDAVRKVGSAVPGDKTMVDAFVPALDAYDKELDAGGELTTATAAAARAAETGAASTTAMQARRGRAASLGRRSLGHQDPGATSTGLILRALAEVVARDGDHRKA